MSHQPADSDLDTADYLISLNDRLSPPARKKRTIQVPENSCHSGPDLKNMEMTICPTPRPFDTTEECVSEAALEIVTSAPSRRNILIKDLPDTKDAIEAEKYIRKTICAELTALMKKGLVRQQVY